MNRWTRNADQRREDYYCEALAFSRHNIDLELDEENMKPERLIKAPEIAGINEKWYRNQLAKVMILCVRLQVARAIQRAPSGTDRTEYEVREPIEDDEEGLAMRPGDVPPPVPERVANPRIREDRAVQKFLQNSEKMHRATYEDAYTRAWFNYCRNVFPQSVRKTGTNTDIDKVSTYQCGILLNNLDSFNWKSEFRKAENMSKPVTQGEKFNVTELPLLREFWRNNDAHVILTAEADNLHTERKQLRDDSDLMGCHSSRSNDLSVHVRLLWESNEIDDKNGHATLTHKHGLITAELSSRNL